MTFIAGFKCADGIVLCADSLEADNFTKRSVDKIKIHEEQNWGIAIAGSGSAGMVDKFCGEVLDALRGYHYDRAAFEKLIEQFLGSYFRRYPNEEFSVLIGVYGGSDCRLYKSDQTYLAPVADHAHIGVGQEIWRLLSESLYDQRNCVENNLELSMFILQQAVEYVDKVDEPIQLVSFKNGDKIWTNKKIGGGLWQMMSGNAVTDFRRAVKKFWRTHADPTWADQLDKFGSIMPGESLVSLSGVDVDRLRTAASRNKYEGFLHGNRDKLQKSARLDLDATKQTRKNQ